MIERYTEDMVHSVGHTQDRKWHEMHKARHQRGWAIMLGVVFATLLLILFGYFNHVSGPTLLNALLHTAYRLAIAYIVALVLGVSVALLVGWSPFSDELFPVFDVIQNIPSFALIPFFIYFFGYTDLMIVLFAVTSIIWPILFAVLSAIKSAHTDLSDAATIFGARGFKRIRYYLFPLSVPSILTGSIVGIALGWDSAIGAELIADITGFGAFIKSATTVGIDQSAVAGVLAILILVFVVNRAIWSPLLARTARQYAE